MKKILLLCSAGMSTSMMVKKMQESAKSRNIEAEILALGLEAFEENVDKYDVFLLGPQVRFKRDDFQRVAEKHGKVVEVINHMDYGLMKGEKILDFALELIK